MFGGFIPGEIYSLIQGHGCSICFADSALGSASVPVNINQARHLNAISPTFRGQQIFNMRLRPHRSHLSLKIEENSRALQSICSTAGTDESEWLCLMLRDLSSRLSRALLAAGLSRSPREIENDKAADTNSIKGSGKMVPKLRTTRTGLKPSRSHPKRRVHFKAAGRLCAFTSPPLDKTLARRIHLYSR